MATPSTVLSIGKTPPAPFQSSVVDSQTEKAAASARKAEGHLLQSPSVGAPAGASLLSRTVTDLAPPRESQVADVDIFNLDLDSWRSAATKVEDRVLQSGICDGIKLSDTVVLTYIIQNGPLLTRWDLNQGTILASYQFDAMSSAILLNNGHVIIVDTKEMKLCLFDAVNGKMVKTLQAGGPITGLSHLKSGLLALVIDQRLIEVWDLDVSNCIHRFEVSTVGEINHAKSYIEHSKADLERMREKIRSKLTYKDDSSLDDHVKHQCSLTPSSYPGEFERLVYDYGYARKHDVERSNNMLTCLYVGWLNELPDGHLAIRMHGGPLRKFSLEGKSLPVSEQDEIILSNQTKLTELKVLLDDGRSVTCENGTLKIWQSRRQTLLPFLEKARGKVLQLPPGLKNEEIDELLTFCEETGIFKGVRLSEQEQSPLFRTRAYHLCPRPRFTLSERASVQIPDDFVCPITTQIMLDPVNAADGESYERAALEEWLQTRQTSPKHGTPLEHTHLSPNRNLQRRIDELLQKYPFLFEQDNGTEHSAYVKGVLQGAKALFARKESNNLLRLIERYPQLMASPLEGDQTLLHMACSQPSEELLRAVIKGLGKNIVPILIKHHVGLFFRLAVRSMGAEGGRIIAMATFWKESDYLYECLEAINRGDKEIVDACLLLGISVDAIVDKKSGNALLHAAVAANQQQMAEFLVDYGADVKLRNSEDLTPEALAYKLGYQYLVKAMYETYVRKLSASQSTTPAFATDRTANLEAQVRQLAEQVAVLQQQMAGMLRQFNENVASLGEARSVSISSTALPAKQ